MCRFLHHNSKKQFLHSFNLTLGPRVSCNSPHERRIKQEKAKVLHLQNIVLNIQPTLDVCITFSVLKKPWQLLFLCLFLSKRKEGQNNESKSKSGGSISVYVLHQLSDIRDGALINAVGGRQVSSYRGHQGRPVTVQTAFLQGREVSGLYWFVTLQHFYGIFDFEPFPFSPCQNRKKTSRCFEPNHLIMANRRQLYARQSQTFDF